MGREAYPPGRGRRAVRRVRRPRVSRDRTSRLVLRVGEQVIGHGRAARDRQARLPADARDRSRCVPAGRRPSGAACGDRARAPARPPCARAGAPPRPDRRTPAGSSRVQRGRGRGCLAQPGVSDAGRTFPEDLPNDAILDALAPQLLAQRGLSTRPMTGPVTRPRRARTRRHRGSPSGRDASAPPPSWGPDSRGREGGAGSPTTERERTARNCAAASMTISGSVTAARRARRASCAARRSRGARSRRSGHPVPRYRARLTPPPRCPRPGRRSWRSCRGSPTPAAARHPCCCAGTPWPARGPGPGASRRR